jgi:tetratricopeptide (TPR) repeat protein
MLVCDDEATLEQSLRSVVDLIGYWVICDTGSSDRTPEIVTRVLAGIPGELHHREWVDFGHNRSELMELAEGKAEYLLLLDPDMTLARSGPLPELVYDAYNVREVGDNVTNGAPRVVQGSLGWWFEGSTHEVLATNGRYSEIDLDMLAIERHIDDASRSRTLLRQLAILERDAATEHPTPTTAFRLAQTLQALGRTRDAITWFRRRVTLGDADQETFYAHFQEGTLLASVDFPSAIPVLLEAWQRRPTRAEPLHELARAYRQRGDSGLAHLFANLGLQIPLPADALFVHRWVYEWGLRFERGWAAGRIGRVDEASDDLRAVTETDGVPADYIEAAQKWLQELDEEALKVNRTTSVREPGSEVPPLSSLTTGVQIGRFELEIKSGWTLFNPSIAANIDGFSMVVRSANYLNPRRKLKDRSLWSNVNYLVELDTDLAVVSVDRIDDQLEEVRRYSADRTGFMDCRLIQVDGRWHASATSRELDSTGLWKMVLLELQGSEATSARLLSGPDPDRDEKNWMPFVRDEKLHFVYSCSPMVVYRCDHRTGRLTQVTQSQSPTFASAFRGSSQGLPLDDGGYLFVIHERYQQPDGDRSYLHRFIRIGDDLRLNAVSRPFKFTDEVREFCAGAAIRGNELVLSFGQKNQAAYLAVLPFAGALGLLEPMSSHPSETQ